MSEWKEFRITDFATIENNRRIPLSSGERSHRKGIYPYYGASGVIDHVDDFLFDGEHVLISEDGENLVSRKTPIAFIADGKFWVNNHAHIVKGKKQLFNKLITYYFADLDLAPYITGAVQPKLSKENLLSIPIWLPESETEQEAITEVLSSLDDKIDLLHRQNKTLESLAQTLFRQWFIEEADDSWETAPLREVCQILNGFAFKSGDYRMEGRTIIRTMNFDDGYIDDSDVVRISFEDEPKYEKYKLEPYDFLLVMVGASLGKFSIVTSDVLPALQNQNMWNFRTLGLVPQHYLNFAIRKIVTDSLATASGSAREFFQKSQFYEKLIPVPDGATLEKFDQMADEFYSKIENNRRQVRHLILLRDNLLPKLMGGDASVRN